MPWKLGDPDEPTVTVKVRMPQSMFDYLQARGENIRGGLSAYIRKLVAERMRKRKRA